MPRPSRALALALFATAALAACATEDAPPDPAALLVGTWEVTGEAGTFNRNGQRYIFGGDGVLQITRPRALGPASTINAAYDFVDDSTLQIRTEFDAEQLRPTVRTDSLLLRPLGTGDPLLLVRVSDDTPAATPAPVALPVDSVYSPPPDAPLDELPPAQEPAP
ncbi:MAG: hypothetical protein AAGI91_11060 [Bacteroidota bacterium]